jgi:hypothetical protein
MGPTSRMLLRRRERREGSSDVWRVAACDIIIVIAYKPELASAAAAVLLAMAPEEGAALRGALQPCSSGMR